MSRNLFATQLVNPDRQIAELSALRSSIAGLHTIIAARKPASCDLSRICSYI